MVKVFVIIPTHNSESTISGTLNSFIAVKEKCPIEINAIIVDDCSEDRTLEIIDNLSVPFKIIQNKSKGVSSARNSALEYLYEFEDTSDIWITFLDSDDYLSNQFFSNLDEKINTFDYIAFEYKNLQVDDVFDGNRSKEISGVNVVEYPFESAIDKAISNFGNNKINFNSPWGRLLKLDFLVKYKFKFHNNLSYKEDFLFNMEVLNKIPRVGTIDTLGYYHVINPESVVNNFVKDAFNNEKFIQGQLLKLSINKKQEIMARYNGWLGLQYVYVFPKHYKSDTYESRKSRFMQVRSYMQPFRIKDYGGHKKSKEFIFFLLYKINFFKILDIIFSFRR
ncbi:hypothetical protein C0W45_02455 [Latilactobacillus curvatus]|nr:hypothetical protein C0W45_02455 [Latilactobacillus curvatus]